MPGGESELLRGDLPGLYPVQKGSGGIVPADHLQRYEVVLGASINLAVVADDVDPLDPHAVLGGLADEVVADPVLGKEPEPVLRSPAEGLPLVGDLGRDDLVENRDVIGVGELQGVIVDLVDLLHLPCHHMLHER